MSWSNGDCTTISRQYSMFFDLLVSYSGLCDLYIHLDNLSILKDFRGRSNNLYIRLRLLSFSYLCFVGEPLLPLVIL